jgi:hypothetical protein
MHSNFRDCDAWRQENLPMNTTSNEAAKLYDVSLTQLVGWYENAQYNGLVNSLKKMTEVDPTFILGQCLKYDIELLGSNPMLNNKESMKNVDDFVKKSLCVENLTRREIMHVKAVEQIQRGNLLQACNLWESILIDHPTDMMAVKMAHTSYFYLGFKRELRDSIARIIPLWSKSAPLYGYLHGMQAFGLTQTSQLEMARENAQKGLAINPFDTWSTHAMTHVNEYSSNFREGIQFLNDTQSDWLKCEHLIPHNFWHLGLFYLENNQIDEAWDVINNRVIKPDDLCNSASFFLRLKIAGHADSSLDDKWKKLKSDFIGQIEHHGFFYTDWHMAMVLAAVGTQEEKDTYFRTLKEFTTITDENDMVTDDSSSFGVLASFCDFKSSYLKHLNKELAFDVFNSIFHYNNGEYDKVVDLLYPIRYKIHRIGGSNAQTDVFNQMLIHSALKSISPLHNKVGLALVNERLASRPNSNIVKRMVTKFHEEHN